MLRFFRFFLLLLTCSPAVASAQVQVINAAYVKALYKRYPTQKSDLCAGCKLWVNPYYRSVADTAAHRPLVTYYVYTRAHREQADSLDLPRKNQYAAWHSAFGQANETKLYRYANTQSADMIAKGHCQAWILLAWSADAAILSDTYTFNAAMEFQGQNIGTEIETEEFCRKLTGFRSKARTDSVKIWCGTFGKHQKVTFGKLAADMPSHYYKVIEYYDKQVGGTITICYWMPNLPTEKRSLLKSRVVSYEQLVRNLGFSPKKVFSN
jgi:DNA/RNA endonuclease G (NUC1)